VRIFLAGASGVIGMELIPLLVRDGHVVAGMTRSPEKAVALRELGAAAVVRDVFDRQELIADVRAFEPDLLMHQLTDLPDQADQIPQHAERQRRIRTEGTHNLIEAAQQAKTPRFIAQSIAWTPPAGSEVITQHEQMVLDAHGLVIRYGTFYGPGTYSPGDEIPPPPRIHIASAAKKTVKALDTPPGILVLTDD
jgi:uncharacterized protein YbjT (DUF2867 family)